MRPSVSNSARRKPWSQRITRRALLRAGARAGVGVAALGAVGAGASSSKIGPSVARASHGGDIRRGGEAVAPFVGPYSGNPPTLDPYEIPTYRAWIPSGYHYSRLIRPVSAGPGVSPTNNAEFEADLASLPETPDSTTYIFRLNPNARWHDVEPLNGRPVTASDIEQSHYRFQQEAQAASGWNQRISSLTTAGQTVRIQTHRPYAPLLTLVASGQHLWIVPPEIVYDGTVARRPVGSGAWIFESYEPDVALRWRRNPDWHGAGSNAEPYLDRVTATMDRDPQAIISGLAEGSLDFSQLSPAMYAQAREAVPDAQYSFTSNSALGGFFFNFSIPPWNDVRVRQALSLALDRDAILETTDPTGQGGWQSAIAQLEPWFLDPQDLESFGRSHHGEPSGTLFHRDLAQARQLLDAAGYPNGIRATLHGTADYGATFTNFVEACTLSAAEAGFTFEFFFKEYSAYIASIFRGNFPDDWDGESSHLAIGPLYGGAQDPDDILAAVYDRSSGRHNWGASGRWQPGAQSHLDTGGYADAWSHPQAARVGGPEADETLHIMIRQQREILELDERREYINDMQRYLATQMYIVPYVSAPGGIYSFNPWVHYRDADRVHIKTGYGWGQEFFPGLWLGRGGDSTVTPVEQEQVEVRIIARRVAGGRIEFGLQPEGASAILPRGRFFPAQPTTSSWLRSTPVEFGGIALGRIRARRLSDGRTEFGFVDAAGTAIEPSARYFPTNAGLNRWLRSSPFWLDA